MITLNGTVILQFIQFFVLVWLLQRYAYKPILKILEARRQKIEQDLASAEAHRKASERLEEEYKAKIEAAREEAKAIISKAERQAKEVAESRIKQADAEIARDKEAAAKEIEAERERAFADMRAEVITLSMAVAEKMVRKELTERVDEQLVDDAIDALQGVKVGL